MLSQRIIQFVAFASVPLFLTACSLSEVRETSHRDYHDKPPAAYRVEPVAPTEGVQPAFNVPRVSTPKPVAVTDIWQYIAAEFTWHASDNPHVRSELDLFRRNSRHVELASLNAEPYIWIIVESIKQRNLPIELALLPLIESSYQANAVSTRGAAGLWQFMPRTGRRFGLKQSRWYDGRRDIVASTNAALDYLTQLHKNFDGNWLLALAAYNCGQATVKRAIAKNASQDFWTVAPDLPSETRRHVAKLIAAVAIFRNPPTYNVSLHPIENSQRFAEIDLGGPLDISALLNDGAWSEQSFKQLNPALSGYYTDPDGPYKILVPYALKTSLVERLASIPATQRQPVRTHRVVANDTLSEIASRYGVSVETIKVRNKLRGNLIHVGKELVITGPLTTQSNSRKQRAAEPDKYVVQNGDSFWTIGRRYGTSPAALAQMNGLSADRPLQIGQVLKLVGRASIKKYAVLRGDSLWTIARKFNVTIEQLKVWNNLSSRKPLQPGQSLVVSGASRDRA
ncbi:MAG: membrane-bound lytic murein transglycosylase D [Gammaproteobacteria bacterium]|jgi:membrane-bound lytic murein transglycosylase D